ncbi:MAG: DUF2062 domain-containing protein [Flavobacteriales bacterium]|nr:DUF2062 domain-containing protein [Flavobacteriales bacterium]
MKKLWFRFHQFVQNYLWISDESPAKRALACAIGLAISVSPFWGFHVLIAVLLSWVFKLNKILTIGFSAITIPPIIPLVVAVQVGIGELIFGNTNFIKTTIQHGVNLSLMLHAGIYLLTGGIFLAIAVGVISYYLLLYILQKKLAKKALNEPNKNLY